jgi:hypothetical protein
MELRKHPRFSVRLPAAFTGVQEGIAWLSDLSRTGGRLQKYMNVLADENDIVGIRLYFWRDVAPIRIDAAIVRWRTHEDMGVEFVILDPNEETRLHQYLARVTSSVQPT